MAAARSSLRSNVGRTGGLLDFLVQKIIQSGAQNDDGRELADFIPTGRDRRAQDVGGELEFKSKRKPAAQFEPNILLAGSRFRGAGGRHGRAPAKEDKDRSQDCLRGGDRDDQDGGSLDGINEVDRQVLKERLHHLLTAEARVRSP